ncbi:trans-sulfuration enzyme family protein [Paenibacillus aceris]|uniref:Cystathionine beta-lyase/cystathionine gamma-synthase n=1 Tax=Paenibacillus aceris TaxID=869555 RepID=A0ABS4I0W2_9BACL|nr:aminotransferase class I/II-fold pyridoxal phosphate-dependent enzyme [Paenibacillus aceris]MBP1964547.1 cystathionine beta-lyase/cystathionine gamma-synthase [Paenibacillus aceris]NHW35744.1 aminotransferase class I/II-fold pyridoxal phosphate-dependent enzyme [Paenibacillus aceris]
MPKENQKMHSIVAHDEHDDRHHGSINVPIYQTSLFSFDTYEQFNLARLDEQENFVYSRGNNPTVRYLEDKLAQLEQGERAKCFASGMAAISAAIMSVVRQGDHVICAHQAYGPTREFLGNYLRKFGVETTFVDGSSMDDWKNAVRSNTKLLYLESPTSMMFQLQDIRKCTELASSIGAETILDNSWATPCFQNPLAMGVGLVVHSITKYISGHSDCVGGVVIGSKRLMDPLMTTEYMLFGGIMTPQTAGLVTRGLRTLPLRMQWHETSGLKVAEFLSIQSYVGKINHPGLPDHPQHELARTQMTGYGSLFSFESHESLVTLRKWADRLQYFRIGASWGGFESLVNVNALNANDPQTCTLVRLYIGAEDPDDLIHDLDQAWRCVALSLSEEEQYEQNSGINPSG